MSGSAGSPGPGRRRRQRQARRVQQVRRHRVVVARAGDVVVQRDRHLDGALGLAEEQRRVVAVRVPDRVDAALARAARPAVVGDDQVGQRAALALQAVQDRRHRLGGVGVPQRGAALQHRHVRELEDVRPRPSCSPSGMTTISQPAARSAAAVARCTSSRPPGWPGREQHPLLARRPPCAAAPPSAPGRRPSAPGRWCPGRSGTPGSSFTPHALRHHREHVLLVGPAVAELQAEPVVAVAVRQLAVVGEVVLAGRGDVARDAGP